MTKQLHGDIKYIYKWLKELHLHCQVCPFSLIFTLKIVHIHLIFRTPNRNMTLLPTVSRRPFSFFSMLVFPSKSSRIATFDRPFILKSLAGSRMTSSGIQSYEGCATNSIKPTCANDGQIRSGWLSIKTRSVKN